MSADDDRSVLVTEKETTTLHGTTIVLDSEETAAEICHIPPGYRFAGYEIKPGMTNQRAECTVHYVEGPTKESMEKALQSLRLASHEEARDLGDGAAPTHHSFLVGKIEPEQPNIQRIDPSVAAQNEDFGHAAVVVHGRTQQNKLFRKRSRLFATVEIMAVDERATCKDASRMELLQSEYKAFLSSQMDDLRAQLVRSMLPTPRRAVSSSLPRLIAPLKDQSMQAKKREALKVQIAALSKQLGEVAGSGLSFQSDPSPSNDRTHDNRSKDATGMQVVADAAMVIGLACSIQ